MEAVLCVSLMINDVEYPFLCRLQAAVNALTDHGERLLTGFPDSALSPFNHVCPAHLQPVVFVPNM